MLFNSIEFLFFFLPIVLIGFRLLQHFGNRTAVTVWLTLASFFFYAWWNPVYLVLLGLSIGVNYSLGLYLNRSEGAAQKFVLALGVLFNLGLLAWFKYANFFIENIQSVANLGFNFSYIILPLAISFYTFQQITYLVDTSKKLTSPHGLLDYCLFVSFFPQLIAGPIVHHKEMFQQFSQIDQPGDLARDLSVGGTILVIGLFKKVVIADSFGLFATPLFSMAANGDPVHSFDVAVASLSYALQLYFDFSGYSDMAIGLACLFGIKLPVNFYSPFRAQNISDFWRMWHATLSRFLRDYVYTPLGGFLCSPRRQRFNLFMTMFAGGVWHGAGWTFVVYGLCHGIYVVIHQLWRIKVSGPLELIGRPSYRAAAQLFTFVIIVLTLVVFRADSVNSALRLYKGLFDATGWILSPAYLTELQATNAYSISQMLLPGLSMASLVSVCIAVAIAVCWLLPSTYQLFARQEVAFDKPVAGRPAVIALEWKPSLAWSAATAVLFILCCLNLTQVSEFLYFQF